MPRILQQAFVFPIAAPPIVLPLFSQPRFDVLALPASILGALFVTVGVVLLVLAFQQIGMIPSSIPKELRKGLVTSGVYGRIRNPIYSAVIAMALGSSLLFRGMYSLAYVPVVFGLFSLITVLEERELEENYGKVYLEYKQTVPYRFIPKII